MEIIAVILGFLYVLLAIQESVLCWYVTIVSSLLFLSLFFSAHLYMSMFLQLYYFLIAIYGCYLWQFPGKELTILPISTWTMKQHAQAIFTIFFLTFISGVFLSSYTPAQAVFADSFITWGSIVTTYMSTKKILENWLYWIVLDAAAMCLYFERGLTATSLLFLIYTCAAVIGFIRWRHNHILISKF